MKVRTHVIYLSVILGIILLFYLAFSLRPPKIKKELIIEHHTDTVTLFDTVTIEKLVPIFIKSELDTVYIESLDTTAVMQRETKVYQGSTYQAQISGFQPQLDYIKTFSKTTYITEYKELKTVKKQRFGYGLQVGVGYGVFAHRPDLYIGFGVHYNF